MRVLVVEDEARMAGLLKRALQEEGHAVDAAADGQEGLWLATENAYGAIVLDVMLPGLDGFQVCRRLRESGSWVPVLMLTARDAVGDRVRGLDRGPLPAQGIDGPADRSTTSPKPSSTRNRATSRAPRCPVQGLTPARARPLVPNRIYVQRLAASVKYRTKGGYMQDQQRLRTRQGA